ncbi:MAG: sigma-70 family RNA polymerase sigma factor [Alistipes sp.]|nr:sigma-70 family RNA polymerase sigma factor [Alistipes sp.]
MRNKPSENIDRLTDAELVVLYRESGGLDVLGELYSRYMPLVYGLCLKYLRDKARAEDAVMQVFEELVAKLARHDVREFRTWLYSVARNHCLGLIRKEKGTATTQLDENFMESDPLLHLLDKKDDELRLARLEECLEQLPEPQKISVRLFFYEERSYADICDTTSYNIKSVKSYIQNGKRNLKNCMERHGAAK